MAIEIAGTGSLTMIYQEWKISRYAVSSEAHARHAVDDKTVMFT